MSQIALVFTYVWLVVHEVTVEIFIVNMYLYMLTYEIYLYVHHLSVLIKFVDFAKYHFKGTS